MFGTTNKFGQDGYTSGMPLDVRTTQFAKFNYSVVTKTLPIDIDLRSFVSDFSTNCNLKITLNNLQVNMETTDPQYNASLTQTGITPWSKWGCAIDNACGAYNFEGRQTGLLFWLPVPSMGSATFKYPPTDPIRPNVEILQLAYGVNERGPINPGVFYTAILKHPRITFRLFIKNDAEPDSKSDIKELNSTAINRFGATLNFTVEPLISYL